MFLFQDLCGILSVSEWLRYISQCTKKQEYVKSCCRADSAAAYLYMGSDADFCTNRLSAGSDESKYYFFLDDKL